MTQIAIYGKGGIGKSTLAANLSVSLSQMGKGAAKSGAAVQYSNSPVVNCWNQDI